MLGGASLNASGTTVFNNNILFNLINGQIENKGDISFNNLTLNGISKLAIDVDFAAGKGDYITINSLNGTGKTAISEINFITLPNSNKLIDIISPNAASGFYLDKSLENLKTPIYNYGLTYNDASGQLGFFRNGFNPAVLAGPVAELTGGYLTELVNYHTVFDNIDMRMLRARKNKKALEYRNKFAFNNMNLPFASLYYPELMRGVWVRPYSIFENVPLKNAPQVSNVMYGTLIGVDSDMIEMKHGFYGMYSAYAGYNGAYQTFDANSLTQNGGVLGLLASFYKKIFMLL